MIIVGCRVDQFDYILRSDAGPGSIMHQHPYFIFTIRKLLFQKSQGIKYRIASFSPTLNSQDRFIMVKVDL